RDHADIDLFLLDSDGDALERMRGLPGITTLPQDSGGRQQQHHLLQYRDALVIDLAIVVEQGERYSVWNELFEFGREGFESRKRSLAWQDHRASAYVVTPELQYLLKIAGLQRFAGEARTKDLADIRSLLPLLNLERLEIAKSGWRTNSPSNSPAPTG
ncbi:MAG: hypothetical protein ACRDHN_20845, partial [Thermomicrobiales bacterium]